VILWECVGSESDPIYQELEVANGLRHYDFLRSIVNTSFRVQRPFLSSNIIKALNFHAIACLHTNAGEFRPCPVVVGGDYFPPDHYRVQAQMDDFVNQVNRNWELAEPMALAAFVLWRLNHIHPFINGNGRTARAASYFVLCVKLGVLLPGVKILPELLRLNRDEYVAALKHADKSVAAGALDLGPLHKLMSELLTQQLGTPVSPDPADVDA